MKQKLLATLDWLRRNLKWIVLGLAACALASTLRACYYGGQVKEVLDTSRPLPQAAVRAILAQGRKDSSKAVHYQRLAHTAIKHAARDSVAAARAIHQADSIHHEIKRLPASTGGPLPAVQKRLSNYVSVDTAKY